MQLSPEDESLKNIGVDGWENFTYEDNHQIRPQAHAGGQCVMD